MALEPRSSNLSPSPPGYVYWSLQTLPSFFWGPSGKTCHAHQPPNTLRHLFIISYKALHRNSEWYWQSCKLGFCYTLLLCAFVTFGPLGFMIFWLEDALSVSDNSLQSGYVARTAVCGISKWNVATSPGLLEGRKSRSRKKIPEIFRDLNFWNFFLVA